MSITSNKNIQLGIGFSSLTDAFQCGREAAQMAKNQLSGAPVNLVVVMGPDTLQFQDFIEGVRLITGEDQLIGIPANKIYSTEAAAVDVYYVILLSSQTAHISITFSDILDNTFTATVTSILHQLRQIRGNASFNEPYGGIVLLEHLSLAEKKLFVEKFSLDVGFKTDVIALTPEAEGRNPFFVRSRSVEQGIVALEYLSPQRWGLGSVDIESFENKPGILKEAVKSALRDAMSQIKGSSTALGILLFSSDNKNFKEEPPDLLMAASQCLPHVPFIGMSVRHQFLRAVNRSALPQKESVIALLIPE